MPDSVLTLIPNGGSEGWDRMGLGYDSLPIQFTPLNAGSTAGKSVMFSLTDAAVAGDISKIVIAYRVAASEAYGASSTVRGKTNTDGTDYETAPLVRAEADATWYYVDVTTNPATGLAWTWTDIDSLSSGIRVNVNYGGWLNLHQFKILVYYDPGVYEEESDVGGNVGISPGMIM